MPLAWLFKMSLVNHSWWFYKDCFWRIWSSQTTTRWQFQRKYWTNRWCRNQSLFIAGITIGFRENLNTHDTICTVFLFNNFKIFIYHKFYFYTRFFLNLFTYLFYDILNAFRGDLMKPNYPRQKEAFCNTIGELLWKVPIAYISSIWKICYKNVTV